VPNPTDHNHIPHPKAVLAVTTDRTE